jgi:hypothetical protein
MQMGDTTLTIDANHELAGQAVSMVVTLISAMDPADRFPDKRTDAEWKEQLGEFEYHVLRMKGTEPGGTGKYDKVRLTLSFDTERLSGLTPTSVLCWWCTGCRPLDRPP